ncbi:MAG: YncE family protein [Candidatus Eremiobacteraeota bacterium]|nr:YncE family protein [Candidatus Eremiobacteraeota bacterium]MBV8365990.1 YncE family protein [Candidatus Eremiobacteraeota bacterium]
MIALIAIVVIAAGIGAYVKHQHDLTLPSRVDVLPADASVFAGSSIALQARLVGGDPSTQVQWTLVGPGSVSAAGVYTAPLESGGSAIVVAHAAGISGAARVRISAPPGDVGLLLVACYQASGVDVRDLSSLTRAGIIGAPEDAAGMAVDDARRLAFVSAKERVMAVDLRTMTAHLSAPLRNSRFSGAAELAGGYFAATDNNAGRGGPGVFIFRIGAGATPQLVASVSAGETPEGIVADADGRTFYVTNVNSDEVIRYAFDGRGGARETGRAQTGHRPYGIALDGPRGLLFVTDNDTPTVSGDRSHPGLEMFQLPALRRVGSPLNTGSKEALPIGVAVDSAAGRVFVTDEGDSNVVVYEVPSLRHVATLPTGKWPWTPTFDARASRLYVPSAHDDAVDVFDTRSLQQAHAPLQTCGYPTNVMTYAPGRTR